ALGLGFENRAPLRTLRATDLRLSRGSTPYDNRHRPHADLGGRHLPHGHGDPNATIHAVDQSSNLQTFGNQPEPALTRFAGAGLECALRACDLGRFTCWSIWIYAIIVSHRGLTDSA